MEPGFSAMADAIRKLVGARLIDFARHGQAFTHERNEQVRLLVDNASAAADLLVALCGQERLIRAIRDVGALVDFPAFSADIAGIKEGSIVLIRAALELSAEHQCRIRIDGLNTTQAQAWIRRSDIIGVEKRG